MFRSKYNKYSNKIRILRLQYGGKRHKHILLVGTSSVGKSTIANLLRQKGYTKISVDDYWMNEKSSTKALVQIEKDFMVLNQYTPNRQNYRYGKREFLTVIHKMMYDDAKNKDVVYDDFSFEIAKFYKKRDDIFIVLMYSSPYQLIDNILNRRFVEPRDRNVFNNFKSTYTLAQETDDYIDIINKREFINKLKEKLKHEFESETDLVNFANGFFEQIGITDDEDHKIKIKNEIKYGLDYDYVIKTANKKPEDIINELSPFTDDEQ